MKTRIRESTPTSRVAVLGRAEAAEGAGAALREQGEDVDGDAAEGEDVGGEGVELRGVPGLQDRSAGFVGGEDDWGMEGGAGGAGVAGGVCGYKGGGEGGGWVAGGFGFAGGGA